MYFLFETVYNDTVEVFCMLTKLEMSGYTSFKQKTIIDFTATKHKMLRDENTMNGILKGAVFVGGNATGKTNIIRAILLLLNLLFGNNLESLPLFCCTFSKNPLELKYTFNINGDEVKYSFVIDKKGTINKELLELNGTPILTRLVTGAETTISEKRYYDANSIDKGTLFLRTVFFNTKFAGNKTLVEWADFLKASVWFNSITRRIICQDPNANLILNQYLANEGTAKLNEFFHSFGFNQEICYDKSHELSSFARIDSDEKHIYLKRNNIDYWMPLAMESLGNQTLLNMLPALIYATNKPCMFIIDEFSSAFHNELEELVIRYFMRTATSSQLFAVSHSTNILKNTLLRPDQIYSVSFVDASGSRIKRFSDEAPRESQNLEKMYLSGIFGGLPNYKLSPNDED